MSSLFPRIIVDANILISAYGCDGEVRRYWRESLRAYKIAVSPEILIEVEARLRNGEFNLSSGEIRAILKDIIDRCDVVRPSPPRDPKFENSKDAHIAALARHQFADGVSATFLLTGDDALCREGRIGKCRILGIGEFCNSDDCIPGTD